MSGPTTGTGDGGELLGYRYLSWCHYVEPKLTAREKAHGNEAFAVEFASMPTSQEPYDGWGQTMADLCQRIARRHRREPLDEA